MPSAWSGIVGAGVALLALGLDFGFGCQHGSQGGPTPPPSSDGGPAALDALRFLVDPGLECADDAGADGICVGPSQVISFGIQGLAGTVVNLSLQGSYADAALTTQTVTLGSTAAAVALESSSTTAAFTVVASLGASPNPSSHALRVTVATSGTAGIAASPMYLGHRSATEYYAMAVPLSTCAEATASAPDASAASWTPGPSGAPIVLSAPAGERVAVEMRIGHYAFGCADVDPLVPDAGLAVTVDIYDIPMVLSLTDLNAAFSVTPDTATTNGWSAVAAAAVSRIEAGFFASSSSDGPALLDAMRTAIANTADQSQFDLARQQGSWDAKATAWMSSHTPAISARAAAWLAAAQGDPVGPLIATIGNGTSAGTAPLTIASLDALNWVAAGVSQPAPFQWKADANDTVHLSGAVDLRSTPLLAHEADALVAASDAGAPDVATAIAQGIDCAGLASNLVGAGVSYGACNAACTGLLCSSALSASWSAVAAATSNGTDAVHATITASGPATVGDSAEPAYIDGGWLGNVSGAGVPNSFAISGAFLAGEPRDGGP